MRFQSRIIVSCRAGFRGIRPQLSTWLAALALAAVTIGGSTARGVALVQEFYLPLPEQQLYTSLNTIQSGISTTQNSIYSIVITGDGTVIYYDQWEDGYEPDLANPTNASTQIWGDGNDAHGIPPGYAHNPAGGFPAGTVITLTNNVSLPRNPSVKLFDGGDRIGATKAIVISRAGWPVTPGPVFGGAVSVLSTMDYGTNYISPVGQDLTNNLFKYVGMFVMASQPGTAVTIDPNGTGIGTTNLVLNQGESYLVNGGVKKGGRITASKPVQAHLIIGHVNGGYAADWFTLYPVQSWTSAYYTPVGSATNGTQPALVYLYNPSLTNITINYSTLAGSGSFVVPGTNGVVQYQMPKGSGGSFVCSGGSPFYALCTVAANPANDTAYNWGFTLLPSGGLTTAATAGWAPGSSDGTVDGSPVWVTPLAATRVYVDYKGDHAGPLTDPAGNKYDTNYDLVGLQSLRIYDPSKNQTGMRVYTLDGTLIAAAWGEDPDVAAPGNPYIDAGTTVLPFPVPVLKKSSTLISNTPPTLLYTVELDNKGLLPLGNTVVIDAPPTNLSYLPNTTTYNGSALPDSVTGTPFPLDTPGYTIPVILSQGSSVFTYKCQIVGGGVISNSVNVGGTAIIAQNVVPTGTNTSTINFTDAGGTTVPSYTAGSNVFLTLTDPGANVSSNTVQTLAVVVKDATGGDFETITLTETGTNTGVFRNLTGLPTSLAAGVVQQDGTLHVAAGDQLTVNYTDAAYGNSCSASATIQTPALNKVLYLTALGTNGVQALDRVNPAATAGHGTNYGSVDIGPANSATVGLDAVTTVSNTAISATFSHVTTAGPNRLMLVGISLNRGTGGSTFETPTNVTYAGTPLTFVGGRTNLTSQEAVVYLFALVNPPAGTNNVVVNWNQTQVDGDVAGCATFTNVNQAAPYGAFFSNTGTSTSVSLTVNSAPGELVFDTLGLRSSNFGASGSPGADQTSIWKTYYNGRIAAGASTQPGAASVTNTWTSASSVDWAIGAVSIKPAAGAGGPATNTTTFTQTPVFCQPFTMPSNSLVTITNFITVTNGSMPTNPAITATLAIGTTNLVTFTNAAYTSANSNLVWTGTLATNVTIPSGAALSYIITNNQSGTAFHIDYDSTNKLSKITVPAGNVIHITGFGVYDAPYPNGSLVSTPAAGTVLYVRASVVDPFGSADITSLGLNITAPSSSANIATNLVSTVANDGCSKTFEYVWQTGPVTGSYSLSATANEGSEGISDTAATSLSLIFLDLGTPSKTEFTAGSNGTATNAYAANATASFRITDLNRNTDPTTVESITAILTSGAGGSNLVTLVETGTNTGIFTNSIATSTNGSGGFLAPVGTLLTLSYTDPGDASDHTTATATILPAPGIPGIAVNKTLVTPAGGKAIIGDAVQFNLQVVNTGSTILTNVTLTDTFPSGNLTFSNASLAPTATTATQLTWTNLGPLGTGQSTNLTVNFTAAASGRATNSASVSSGPAAGNGAAVVTITHPAVTVLKTLLSPTN
jgi:large repetitive protein